MDRVRVRFAPSPTGHLHRGNVRTALFNWLFARGMGGSFILRIEDTDLERSKAEYTAQIMDDLRWLGIDWDEGPDKDGGFGPYLQSQRLPLYREALEKLKAAGKIYPCYCTDEELTERRERLASSGGNLKYDGRCRELTRDQIEGYRKRGIEPSWRFVIEEKTLIVSDVIRGDVAFDTGLIGDFIVMRSNGMPSFNLAVSVDDVTMGITHVIRGEDHLSNTPKHILLIQSLGAEPPVYAHMSMTLGPDGTRLSKRHGATSLNFFARKGYPPEGVMNYLALLGWSPDDEEECMTKEQLIQKYSLERMSKSASVFDEAKLNWLCGLHIRNLDDTVLADRAEPFLRKAGLLKGGQLNTAEKSKLEAVMGVVKNYIAYFDECGQYAALYYEPQVSRYEPQSLEWLAQEDVVPFVESLIEQAQAGSFETREKALETVKAMMAVSPKKGKAFFMTLRSALTGTIHGPEFDLMMAAMGKTIVLSRLSDTLTKLKGGDIAAG